MKYGFTLTLKDLASAAFNKLGATGKSTLNQLTQASDKFKTKMAGVGNSVDGLRNKLDALEKKRNLSLDLREIKSANREIEHVEKQLRKLQTAGTGGGTLAGISAMGRPILAGAGIAAAGAGVFAKEAIQTGAKVETQSAVLALKVGQKKADEGFTQLSGFIDKFRLPMEETREMFIALSSKGITPTMDKMEAWGNILARTPSKNPMQMAEALMDAMGGEFVRMQEFGIRGKQVEGGKIQLKDIVTGYGQTIANDPTAIMGFIEQVGKLPTVAGMLATKAKTTEGAMIGLQNAVTLLKVNFADGLRPATGGAIASLTELVKVLAQYAKPAAEGLASGLALLTKGIKSGLSWMAAHKDEVKAMGVGLAVVTTAVIAITAATWLWNVALLANPIGGVVLAIAALSAGLYYAYQKSEGFRIVVNKLWSVLKPTVIAALNFQLSILSTTFGAIAETGFGALGVVSAIVKKMGVLGQILKWVSPGLALFMDMSSALDGEPGTGTRGKKKKGTVTFLKRGGAGAKEILPPTTPFSQDALAPGQTSLASAAERGERTGVKNFYINIEKLIEQFNVYQTASENASEIRRAVTETLVSLSNDVQLLTD